MKKNISAYDLAYIFTLIERINAFHHAQRNIKELKEFNSENYSHINNTLYNILGEIVGEEAIDLHSDLDIDPSKQSFEYEVDLWLKCISG